MLVDGVLVGVVVVVAAVVVADAFVVGGAVVAVGATVVEVGATVVVAAGAVVVTGATVSVPLLHPEATSRNTRATAYFLTSPVCHPSPEGGGATPEPQGVDTRRRSAESESTDTSVGFEKFRLLRVELRFGQDS